MMMRLRSTGKARHTVTPHANCCWILLVNWRTCHAPSHLPRAQIQRDRKGGDLEAGGGVRGEEEVEGGDDGAGRLVRLDPRHGHGQRVQHSRHNLHLAPLGPRFNGSQAFLPT